jgi:FtsP/CotA-like multicopper oxidase with cupredoxin domain
MDNNSNNTNDNKPHFEIVGLHLNSGGRTCTMHSHCGMHVQVGDILRLVLIVVTIRPGQPPEDAIKLVKITDGTETCTVGYVPRSFARLERIKGRVGEVCVVLEVYDTSNKYKKLHSKKNFGVASCMFINDVPRQE